MAITSGPPPLAARRSAASTPTATYTGRIGTSPAAAQVAGVAALDQISSSSGNAGANQERDHDQRSTLSGIAHCECTPDIEYAGRCGTGMLDATRALQAAGPPVVVTPARRRDRSRWRDRIVYRRGNRRRQLSVDPRRRRHRRRERPLYTTPALAAADNNVAFAVVMSNSFGTTTSPAAVVTVNSGASNSPSGGGALPLWQLVLLSALLLAGRVRVAYRKQ